MGQLKAAGTKGVACHPQGGNAQAFFLKVGLGAGRGNNTGPIRYCNRGLKGGLRKCVDDIIRMILDHPNVL